jgi:hypothetical protein
MEKGFSLLETIIAIFILSVGIIGIASLINRTAALGTVVKNQLIASHLAQEGIELMHNLRNTNWVQGSTWENGLTIVNCQPTPLVATACPIMATLDFNSAIITPTSIPADWIMSWNGANYIHDPTDGFFSRHIEISYEEDTDNVIFMEVKSIVEWDGKTMEVEERLYNWQ